MHVCMAVAVVPESCLFRRKAHKSLEDMGVEPNGRTGFGSSLPSLTGTASQVSQVSQASRVGQAGQVSQVTTDPGWGCLLAHHSFTFPFGRASYDKPLVDGIVLLAGPSIHQQLKAASNSAEHMSPEPPTL